MVKLQMQFPNVKGSTLYDGTKHDVDAVDCVQYLSSNVYIVEYIDHKINKRSRAIFNRGTKNVSHVPLMNKTGINDLFNYWKTKPQRLTVDELFAKDRDIGVTEIYPDLNSFLTLVKNRLGLSEGITLEEAGRILEETNKADENTVTRPRQFLSTSNSSFMSEVLSAAADTSVEPEPEVTYYQGVPFKNDGKGPMGLPSSYYWYERGNAPYGTRGSNGPMGGPPPPPPMGGPMGGPPPGPPPEDGPGFHK